MPAIGRAVKPQPRTAVSPRRPAGGGVGVAPARQAPSRSVAPSPSAPPLSPQPAYTPWNSAYETSVAGARAKYNNALAALGYNRQALQQDYGIEAGFNDYKSNPYSRAAELQRSYERANRGSQTSLGSSGHLYSGAMQNQLGYNRSARDQGSHELQSSYLNALQEIRNKELGAGDELNEAIGNAAWRRVESAEREPLDPSLPVGTAPPPRKKHKARIAVGKARRAR